MQPSPAPIKAAQYVRMSTDMQVYSTANQEAAIAIYADHHGFEIVRTYADEGRSGLQLRGRTALQALLADVLSDDPGFNAILVYDISRWGRFQDADESAHYEFLCRKAGVPIHYCAEPFSNDGSLSAAIMKSLKRVMAGEFSRELSRKVFEGQCRLALRGFKMGGRRRYGYHRMLVDGAGEPKGLLAEGEQKHLRSDHVILVPGPAEEVATVQRIFRLSAWKGLSTRQIARRLNAEGSSNINGRPWTGTGVAQILRSENYSGTMIFGKASKKLGGREIQNDPAHWIRCEDAIEPLVDRKTFEAARRGMMRRTWSQPDAELLDRLRRLHDRLGRLSVRDVLKEPGMPMPATYRLRFGSFTRACQLAGYVRPRIAYAGVHPTLIFRTCALLEDAATAIRNAGGRAELDERDHVVLVDGRWRLGATWCRAMSTMRNINWRIHLRAGFDIDLLLVGLLRRPGDIHDGFALLPANRFGTTRNAYISQKRTRAANNRFSSLGDLHAVIREQPA